MSKQRSQGTKPAEAQATVLLGVDPGTQQTGWAVLTATSGGTPTLLAHGTMIPRSRLIGMDRQLWLLSRLQDIIAEHPPQILAYEGFTWRADELYVRGRPGMERLIGGIQALALMPPYPVLVELLPARWGAQLVGQRQHTKAQIAFAVNCRLGTTFKGDTYDNHKADAIGIALVVLDTLKAQHYQNRYGKGWNALQKSSLHAS